MSYKEKKLNKTIFPAGVWGVFRPRRGGVDYVVRSCSKVRPCSVLCQRNKKLTGQGQGRLIEFRGFTISLFHCFTL